jgi:hypothetical protein
MSRNCWLRGVGFSYLLLCFRSVVADAQKVGGRIKNTLTKCSCANNLRALVCRLF